MSESESECQTFATFLTQVLVQYCLCFSFLDSFSKLRARSTSRTRISSVKLSIPLKRPHCARTPLHRRPRHFPSVNHYCAASAAGCAASLQIIHERNPSPNGRPLELMGVNSKPRRVPEDNVGEGSNGYSAKFVAPHSPSEVTRLEFE